MNFNINFLEFDADASGMVDGDQGDSSSFEKANDLSGESLLSPIEDFSELIYSTKPIILNESSMIIDNNKNDNKSSISISTKPITTLNIINSVIANNFSICATDECTTNTTSIVSTNKCKIKTMNNIKKKSKKNNKTDNDNAPNINSRSRGRTSPNYGVPWSKKLVEEIIFNYKIFLNSWSKYKIKDRTSHQVLNKGQSLVKKAHEKYSDPCLSTNSKLLKYYLWYWSDQGKKERKDEKKLKKQLKK